MKIRIVGSNDRGRAPDSPVCRLSKKVWGSSRGSGGGGVLKLGAENFELRMDLVVSWDGPQSLYDCTVYHVTLHLAIGIVD